MCQNIGSLKANVTRSLKFSYIAFCHSHNADKFWAFGELTFYHMDDGSAVTATARAIDASMETKICNADYYAGN